MAIDHTPAFLTEPDINRLRARFDYAAQLPWLYIAGPMLSYGNAYVNIREGVMAGEYARKRGWHPIVPHLDAFVTMMSGPIDLEVLMTQDFGLIGKCDAVLFLDDWEKSTGAKEEHAICVDYDIPRFYGLVELPKAKHKVEMVPGIVRWT